MRSSEARRNAFRLASGGKHSGENSRCSSLQQSWCRPRSDSLRQAAFEYYCVWSAHCPATENTSSLTITPHDCSAHQVRWVIARKYNALSTCKRIAQLFKREGISLRRDFMRCVGAHESPIDLQSIANDGKGQAIYDCDILDCSTYRYSPKLPRHN